MGASRSAALVIVGVLVVICLDISSGESVFDREKAIKEEDKRGAAPLESKNEVATSEEIGTKSKRGLTSLLGSNKRQFGLDGLSHPSGYGVYEPGRYGPSGFPVSSVGNYGDERRPPYIDDEIKYHHTGGGGGYIGGRPTAYGPGYSPPPRYPGDYDDHYPGSPGHGGGDIMGGVQMSTIKKILIPLAGLAILGVAAAASHNPVLLPLGTLTGRRKRSLWPLDVYPPNPLVKPLKNDTQ